MIYGSEVPNIMLTKKIRQKDRKQYKMTIDEKASISDQRIHIFRMAITISLKI
ncbi:MAG: hypothetical protein ABIR03_02335 [Ginsengibacter sp.]